MLIFMAEHNYHYEMNEFENDYSFPTNEFNVISYEQFQVDLSSLELTPKQLELLLHVETMPSVENLHVFGSHNCLWLKNISPRALAKISKRCPRLR